MKKFLTILPIAILLSSFALLASYTSAHACVDTALGCVDASVTGIVGALAKLVLGIAGGIAVILIIIGGFRVGFSRGDPEALQEGRSMITSAIIGLVFILLSTTILGILGINLLGIQWFNWGGGGSIQITKP